MLLSPIHSLSILFSSFHTYCQYNIAVSALRCQPLRLRFIILHVNDYFPNHMPRNCYCPQIISVTNRDKNIVSSSCSLLPHLRRLFPNHYVPYAASPPMLPPLNSEPGPAQSSTFLLAASNSQTPATHVRQDLPPPARRAVSF